MSGVLKLRRLMKGDENRDQVAFVRKAREAKSNEVGRMGGPTHDRYKPSGSWPLSHQGLGKGSEGGESVYEG